MDKLDEREVGITLMEVNERCASRRQLKRLPRDERQDDVHTPGPATLGGELVERRPEFVRGRRNGGQYAMPTSKGNCDRKRGRARGVADRS